MRDFVTHSPDVVSRPFIYALLVILPALFIISGCDDILEEEPRSVITPEEFFQTEEEFRAALAPVYAQLRVMAQFDPWNIQQHSSDETMVPTRGADWDDGGQWRDLTQHEWDFTNPVIDGAWGTAFTGAARANSLIASLNITAEEGVDFEAFDAFFAEARFLRAYYYYYLMDAFGNIPFVVDEGGELEEEGFPTQPVDESDPPPNIDRNEVFDVLLSEMTGCGIDQLDVGCVENPQEGSILAEMPEEPAEYGRTGQMAAYALLARMLINGDVYSSSVDAGGLAMDGRTFFEEARAAAETVINSGQFALESDYFTNFTADNQVSSENIFVATHDADDGLGFEAHAAAMHYNQLPQTPWNGFTTIADFYASFDVEPGDDGELGTREDEVNDDRANQFMRGTQYQEPSDGCQGAECFSDPESGVITARDVDDPLEFTAEIDDINLSGGTAAIENPGLRPLKYEIDPNRDGFNWGNDHPLLRLAEMYLILAEAENELGNTGEAVNIIDDIRERSNAAPYDGPQDQSTVAAAILQERGHELHYEQVRRTDMIRYEARGYEQMDDPYAVPFTEGEWVFKTGFDDHRVLFPIPESQLDANPALEQNPGY